MKDAQKLSAAGLRPKAEELLEILRQNPYQNPPPYEKLVGDLAGAYSRRINIQHRLVYQILEEERLSKCCGCGATTSSLRNQPSPRSCKAIAATSTRR